MTNIPVSERAQWIGASESAALFGASPYTTRFELFHQKIGNIPSPNLDNDDRVNAGQFMEPSIAAWASHKWNWPVLSVAEYRKSQRVQRMGCSLDFETVDGLEPVEIKNVDNLIFLQGDDWQCDGDTLIDCPAHMLIQVQHQLACPGPGRKPAERGWLVVCVGGNKLYRMKINRHPIMIERIEHEVAQFWNSVAANEAPEPDFQLDANAINVLYQGNGVEFIDLRGNDRARDLAAIYLEGLETEKRGRERKKASLAELKVLMQDAQSCVMDGGYQVKASHLKECTTVRKAHWRFSVTKKKD